MRFEKISVNHMEINVWSLNTVVVGTGAAGLNAADHLYNLGQEDVAIVTEGINMGTSRNTGSDKQTYYKLTLAGDAPDSVAEMAKTLYSGGARHGDVALVEAALSTKCFYKLIDIGVDFPHNRYGEYAGYKTDHDPRQRATSLGPYTSRIMTEKLERQVRMKGIRIFDQCLVIGILTDQMSAVGLVALDMSKLDEPGMGITLFNCTNIIYATGGPAGMYAASVYPESQTGALGIGLEAGVKGVNLTESQYGIASIKFRWNLSGSYQQVIPRYISTDQDGSNATEFLDSYFPDKGSMLTAIFLKGYQWPFDPRKLDNYGSSLIDLLVYNETCKGRRVFLDYRYNPTAAMKDGQFDFSLLADESFAYLKNSGILMGTPIERLCKLNMPAIELYRDHGIDLAEEPLEIAVCAQHSNGGLQGNIWWESNIAHFFPVGEANGSFGVYRPGGSALNATQVGGVRAAEYINRNYRQAPPAADKFIQSVTSQVEEKLKLVKGLTQLDQAKSNLKDNIVRLQKRMTKVGAHVRCQSDVEAAISECYDELLSFPQGVNIASRYELPDAFRYYDMLVTQFAYLAAIREYMRKGGQSRGSYIISSDAGTLPASNLPDQYRYCIDDGRLMDITCEVHLKAKPDWHCSFTWIPVHPLPQEDNWFENVWASYRAGEVWK